MKEFNSLYNYKNAFSTMKVIVITITVASFIFAGGIFYVFTKNQEESTTRVWVKTTDGSMFAADKNSSITLNDRIVEYKHHVKWFYTLWYTLNKANHEENINAALNLANKTVGEEQLDVYQSQSVFDKLQRTGRRFESEIIGDPEIQVNENGVIGRIMGTLTFIDENGEAYRKQNLNIEFLLNDVLRIQGRTDNNPHGVLISGWKILDDSEIVSDN